MTAVRGYSLSINRKKTVSLASQSQLPTQIKTHLMTVANHTHTANHSSHERAESCKILAQANKLQPPPFITQLQRNS